MKRLLFLIAFLLFPASAHAQLKPSLKIDSNFAPLSGVAADGFATEFATESTMDVAVHGDRIYTVGYGTVVNDVSAVVIARHKDGTYDPTFSGDGKLVMSVSLPGEPDNANAVSVLPDGRLRVAGHTDVGVGTDRNDEVVIVGLLPNGDLDPSFGDGNDGVQLLSVSSGNDSARRIAIDAAGRILLGGYTSPSNIRDAFVALLNPDGSPVTGFGTNGVQRLPAANGFNDEAKDVAFRPGGGVAVLVQNAGSATSTNDQYPDATGWIQGLREDGSVDPAFGTNGVLDASGLGARPVNPLSMLVHRGRLWVSGNVKTGVDQDAFVARAEGDGTGLQVRRFDYRGTHTGTDAIVSSAGRMVVLPGPPETMVVVGESNRSGNLQFSAAAFYEPHGDLAAAPAGDVVIETSAQTLLNSVAVESPTSVIAGGLILNTNNNLDQNLATMRLLLDADKACDLAIDVPTPLELTFLGRQGTAAQIAVENKGERPCGSEIALAAPYKLGRAINTGIIPPGGRFVADNVPITAATIRRDDDVAKFSVSGPGDKDATNNVRGVRAVFSFCDLALSAVQKPATVPNEGGRRVEIGLRNAGTRTCRGVKFSVANGSGAGLSRPYSVERGRSVSDDVVVSAKATAKVGSKATVRVTTSSTDEDVVPANDSIRLTARVVGVGDTRVSSATAARLSGSATPGKGTKADRKGVRLTGVEVAVRKLGSGCRWLSGKNAKFTNRETDSCTPTGWQKASGTRSWRFTMRALPAGRYEVYTRAVTANGFKEGRFSTKDGNRRTFRVR
ncbi:hypothetical protein DVA67_029375 [Solirubrobacter sp. CPCC 204708]|uniref:CARDB domain-containing protein n=1 Tax=Solirubrobacter deserti TaxID=2282478 RepID=A0ABT4RMS5_9ACTN|nr:hypothetical protein [Solirubrobacter deserti]MBE2320113.1 hypothetical protein [Solirubrobacter deserti]MDA0139831.1 hypothetical protein [Solirubrobacter deserti]